MIVVPSDISVDTTVFPTLKVKFDIATRAREIWRRRLAVRDDHPWRATIDRDDEAI